jgi:hypothetical protein
MGLMDINKELKGFKGLGVTLKHTPAQSKYLKRDLAAVEDETLWKEVSQLRDTAIVTFVEMGRRLTELQTRYSNNKKGDFQSRYTELGFKKMEVYTLIKKYSLYSEDVEGDTNLLLETQDNYIVRTADNISEAEIVEKIDKASQRTTEVLTTAPKETREKFYRGEINSAAEIKESSIAEKYDLNKTIDISKQKEQIKPGEIIKAAVIEEDRETERVKELTAELKDINSEINELLEAERKLKRLREQKAEIIEELSKARNLKLV